MTERSKMGNTLSSKSHVNSKNLILLRRGKNMESAQKPMWRLKNVTEVEGGKSLLRTEGEGNVLNGKNKRK